MIAPASSPQKLPTVAKTRPLNITITAPSASTRRLPSRSAVSVKKKLMSISPTKVKVMNNPILVSDMPRADRYRARIRVDEPYAKRRTKRWRISNFASLEASYNAASPISLAARPGRLAIPSFAILLLCMLDKVVDGGMGDSRWRPKV